MHFCPKQPKYLHNTMRKRILDFINLHNGEETREKVLETVKANTSFRGANLWILACAIVIASVGLNVNSTAVIIGAMLISPLMGPIVGSGFALAIHDIALLKKSVKNLLIATLVSLSVATVYFLISPFKETQSELLARTSPNIYDVIIAFFGGLVGVIALTRVEKGNPIPGVAIATALMPPLCTAGFGLATGNITYFTGAFYLYTINCFFICISTFLIIKYLKYAPVKTPDARFEKRIRFGITLLILVMIIPSFYMAYNLFTEKSYNHRVEAFIEAEFTAAGYTPIYRQIRFNSQPKKIELAFLNKKFTPEEITTLNQRLSKYAIDNTDLSIIQDSSDLPAGPLRDYANPVKMLAEKEAQIRDLQSELITYKIDARILTGEMAILFPELSDISFGRHSAASDSSTVVMLYRTATGSPPQDGAKIERWLEQKLGVATVRLVRQP
jgi:uncharacterized hydrophobic protein (TIGR00271 family)